MNTVLLDEVFLRQVSSRLEKFKQTSRHHYNARCIICGDSKSNRNKARWHAFQHNKQGFMVCKCFNCGYTNSFENFLKEIDPETHKMYLMEKFKGDASDTKVDPLDQFKQSDPIFDTNPLKNIKKISQLGPDHPVKKWIEARGIPTSTHYRLYCVSKFKKWVNSFYPNKFESLDKDEPRLVIPLLDEQGNMFGLQGRSFDNNSRLRYITIMLQSNRPRIFGLDCLDWSKLTYCVEGPIDSLFLSNGIASCGGDINSELVLLNMSKDSMVIVYDNEPRGQETIKKIDKCIDLGYRVCIWPDSMVQKDINEMVLAGYKLRQIHNTINDNTYMGLEAKLKLNAWRKV